MPTYYDPDERRYIDCELVPLPGSGYTGHRSSMALVMDEAPHESTRGPEPTAKGPHRNRPIVPVKVSSYEPNSGTGMGWRLMMRAHPNARPCPTCPTGFLRPHELRRRFARCFVCRGDKRVVAKLQPAEQTAADDDGRLPWHVASGR